MELLIGCGNKRVKQVTFEGIPSDWTELVTLDIDPGCKPDIVCDLSQIHRCAEQCSDARLPFKDGTFDEIHAYEVLEHCGTQGDYDTFFAQFEEFHRILKPGGWFIATCPMWDSQWAWGDPGHTRVITRGSLVFLDQQEYAQVGKTPMTDYRHVYSGDFETYAVKESEHTMGFVLKARK